MSDQAGLLRAIVEEPEDAALRLVYADWLEENGHDRHAAFIRAQCALDALLVAPRRPYYGVDHRYIGYEHLDPALAAELLGPLLPLVEGAGVAWRETNDDRRSFWAGVRRGFVEQATLSGRRLVQLLVRHAPDLFARLPIRTLALNGGFGGGRRRSGSPLSPAALAQLLAEEGVRRLEVLDLYSFRPGPEGVAALLAVGPVAWKTLRLNPYEFSPDDRDRLQDRFGAVVDLEDDIPF